MDDVYESIRVTPLSHEEVIQLFAQKSGIAVDAKLRPMVDQICGILEDTPVAIAAIANWIRHITIEPDETEMLLDGLVQWLASVHPSAQDRVQAAIERSSKIIYGKLDSTERHILTMVATVPGTSVNRDWLESSYGQQTIEKLESLELLHANSPRMRLPEALKEYIQSPPADWVSGPKVCDTDTVDFPASVSKLEEWREWWLTSPIQTLKDLKQDERYLDLIAGELGNLLGGLEWGFRKQRWEDVINLGQMIDPYLALHGLWDVWGTVLTQIQVAAQNLEDPQRRSEVQAWVLHQLGTRELGIGDRNQAIRLLKGALEMRLRDGSEQIVKEPNGDHDTFITVDCADFKRVGKVFEKFGQPDINIDHHKTNEKFGRLNLIEAEEVATAAILTNHLPEWGFPIDRRIAAALLTGIITDTLGFRTANTTPESLRQCATLMETGVDMPDLYMRSLVKKSFPAARYWGAGLASMEQKNGIVWGTLTLDDRKKSGYGGNDDADLINMISAIDGNKVGMIFVEQSDNHVKISWRALVSGIDESQVAKHFKGGGHAAAAGADIPGTLGEIQPLVLRKTRDMWTLNIKSDNCVIIRV